MTKSKPNKKKTLKIKPIILGMFLLVCMVSSLLFIKNRMITKTVDQNIIPIRPSISRPTASPQIQFETYVNDDYTFQYPATTWNTVAIANSWCISSVPTKIFEDGNTTIISFAYTMLPKKCVKVENTISNLKQMKYNKYPYYTEGGSGVTVLPAFNDNDINTLIKQIYGTDCSYGGKTKAENWFDITVVGGIRSDFDSSNCLFPHVRGFLRWYPTNNKLVSIILGSTQSCYFGISNNECAEKEIANTFSFNK